MKQNNVLKGVDLVILIATGLLLLVGLVILQSASGPSSYKFFGNAYTDFISQLQKGVLPGLFLFLIFANFSLKWLRKLSILGWITMIGLNVLVWMPGIGVEVNGARRWIEIASFRIQPAEFLKLALLICMATILFHLGKNINRVQSLLWITFVIGISAGIVIVGQSSLSNGIILIAIALSMLFQSKIKFKFIAIFAIITLITIIVSIFYPPDNYRLKRIKTLLKPEQVSSLDEKYQTDNNMIAVGSGGLLGVGLGESRQKFFYLPEASTDSIFAVFAEEAGFVGVILLLALFLTIIFRILFLYTQISDDFWRYILIGGVTWFTTQTLVNIAPTIQLAPVTGVPLPFVSEGGTSMMVFCALFGIIANISKYRNT
jgi:cell division protein FtsW